VKTSETAAAARQAGGAAGAGEEEEAVGDGGEDEVKREAQGNDSCQGERAEEEQAGGPRPLPVGEVRVPRGRLPALGPRAGLLADEGAGEAGAVWDREPVIEKLLNEPILHPRALLSPCAGRGIRGTAGDFVPTPPATRVPRKWCVL